MKKLFSVLLVLALILTMAAAALAEDIAENIEFMRLDAEA